MTEHVEPGSGSSSELIVNSAADQVIQQKQPEWDTVSEASWESVPGERPTSLDWTSLDRAANSSDVGRVAEGRLMQVEITGGDILVDAALLGELLGVIPAEVPTLMRTHAITSLCERGVDAHHGEFRLSFFYRNRRARLSVDTSGHILRRSVIDFGQQPLPRALHRSGE
jgi:hypothetical protein